MGKGIKEFLKRRGEDLTLVLILDSRGGLWNGRRRREVERCLRMKLRPPLNPFKLLKSFRAVIAAGYLAL